MISAFGVEHTISKGLPRALVGRGLKTGTGTQTIRMNNRVAAHEQGKLVARRGNSADEFTQKSKQFGQQQKKYYKQGLSGPGGRSLTTKNGFGVR